MKLTGIKKNIKLAPYTTFKIGGPAKYFFISKTKKDLIKAILFAKKEKLPFFILGGGGNVLVSDRGFRGMVIKVRSQKSEVRSNKIFAETGISLGQLVQLSLKNNLSGLEWAIGIPGTLGGAIYGNAGAFGKSIGDNIKEVEVLDLKKEKTKILKNKECQFSYRETIFKKKQPNLIIFSAKLQLKKGNKSEIEEKIKEYLNYRKRTQPLNFPSAGSVFINPKGFSAGELIEKCGLKGKKIGQAQISAKHANFILNLGGAKAKDVEKLIILIKKKVKNKFEINLKEEIQYLG